MSKTRGILLQSRHFSSIGIVCCRPHRRGAEIKYAANPWKCPRAFSTTNSSPIPFNFRILRPLFHHILWKIIGICGVTVEFCLQGEEACIESEVSIRCSRIDWTVGWFVDWWLIRNAPSQAPLLPIVTSPASETTCLHLLLPSFQLLPWRRPGQIRTSFAHILVPRTSMIQFYPAKIVLGKKRRMNVMLCWWTMLLLMPLPSSIPPQTSPLIWPERKPLPLSPLLRSS